MSVSKLRISSPLEAGPSLLEAHNLPPHLTEALDYVSKRLAKKALHVTFVVVRKDYQLPGHPAPPTPVSTPASPPATPGLLTGSSGPLSFSAARFASMSPVAGLRQLVRRGTSSSLASAYHSSSTSLATSASVSSDTAGNDPTSPPPPPSTETTSTAATSSPRRWPPTPLSPSPHTPMTPHTPCSISTTATTTTATTTASSAALGGVSAAGSPSVLGIQLVYAAPPPPRAEKVLRAAVVRAERKFRIDPGWLPLPQATGAGMATETSPCALAPDLVRRSILQNEVLFSSEGLSILKLDRLYSFKSALAAYARASTTTPASATPTSTPRTPRSPPLTGTGSTSGDDAALTRIEDAVDELRRLVLGRRGRPVGRADLYRSYEWLGVSGPALADVERMYRRAYGGSDRIGAFIAVEASPSSSSSSSTSSTSLSSSNTSNSSYASFSSREDREKKGRREATAPMPAPTSTIPTEVPVQTPAATTNTSELPPTLSISPPSPPRNPAAPTLRLNTNVAVAKPKVVRPKPKLPAPRRAEIEDAADNHTGIVGADVDGPGSRGEEGGRSEDDHHDNNGLKTKRSKTKRKKKAQGVVVEAEIHQGSFLSLEDDESDEENDEVEGQQGTGEDDDDDEEEDGDRTALPPARQEAGMPHFCWSRHGMSASIDGMLLQVDGADAEGGAVVIGAAEEEDLRDSRFLRQSQASSMRIGPMTPNGYDDISPTTRGEWGFLFAGDGWKQGKTAAVETC